MSDYTGDAAKCREKCIKVVGPYSAVHLFAQMVDIERLVPHLGYCASLKIM